MKTRSFHKNPVFRVAAPAIFGVVIYLLVLMFFDSVVMLASNFFSREVLFVVLLTYVFFELNRLVILLTGALPGLSGGLLRRMVTQYAIAFVLTASVISLSLYTYFIYIEGFSTIITELVTFNALYLFAAVFYHLYFFSIHYLYKRNDELVRAELVKRDNLQLELAAYKSQINPEFLFVALEIIIEVLHRNKKEADTLIDELARIYRYILDNRQNELVELESEMKSLEPMLKIFSSRYSGAITINHRSDGDDQYFMVPGTLLTTLEHVVISSLITPEMPMDIRIEIEDRHLTLSYPHNERINAFDSMEPRIGNLARTYRHLSGKAISSSQEKDRKYYRIPLLSVEEE